MDTVLLKLLRGLDDDSEVPSKKNKSDEQQNGVSSDKIGIGMDCSVTPLKYGDLSLIQTTDFFYPLVDDPYKMGRIAAANVLSDLYAMGVQDCDNMLMILGVSTEMTENERDIVIPMMLRGFRDCATSAGTSVSGGQTVQNPWLTIGGVASTVCQAADYIPPDGAIVGDVLLLTKPMGTQVAVNAFEWIGTEHFKRLKTGVSEEDVKKGYLRAVDSMGRLNRTAAKLMHKYNAHAATDVTGFGLLGHAQNLAQAQKNEVSFVIHNLPIIAQMATVARLAGNIFGLLQGYSAETSGTVACGGLLISLPREQAAAFCRDIEKTEGYPAWIVGVVEKGNKTARIIDKPRVIEVPAQNDPNKLW